MKSFETFVAENPDDKTQAVGADEQHDGKPLPISPWQTFSDRFSNSDAEAEE